MTKRTHSILVTLVVLLAGWVLPVRAIAQPPVEHTGGATKAYLSKTQNLPDSFTKTTWTNLPGSALRLTVPGGTTDLFHITFSAECRLVSNEGLIDWAQIRIVAVVNGVGSVVQPDDSAGSPQSFCAVNHYSTHMGSWVLRGGPGDYRFSVQVLNSVSGNTIWLDDWTFSVVVYD